MANDDYNLNTRYLGDANSEPMPRPRTTKSLEQEMPSLFEFRVVSTGQTIQIPVRSFLILGRGDNTNSTDQPDMIDLTPYGAQSLGVSRQHTLIMIQSGRVMIKDNNSMNGTFLNNYALEPYHAYRLRHGDELRLGRLTLQVLFIVTEGV